MEKARRICMMTLFCYILIWLDLFGCAIMHNQQKVLESSYTSTNKTELSNFVFLIKQFHTTIPDPWCLDDCETEILLSSASGSVLTNDKSSIYVLTAAHFCVDDENFTSFFKEDIEILGFTGPRSRRMEIFAVDNINDICLLKGPKFTDEKYKNIKIAKNVPKIGERVINIAAPHGVAGPQIRLLFDGHFGGCDDTCVFTVPASFGSSGSAIYNEDGELVTILVAVLHDFKNVSLGPTNKQIWDFILSVDELVDIYE